MNDPTGFYQSYGWGFLGIVLLMCLWYGLASLRNEVERHRIERQLRTTKTIQKWLRNYLESGGRFLG